MQEVIHNKYQIKYSILKGSSEVFPMQKTRQSKKYNWQVKNWKIISFSGDFSLYLNDWKLSASTMSLGSAYCIINFSS